MFQNTNQIDRHVPTWLSQYVPILWDMLNWKLLHGSKLLLPVPNNVCMAIPTCRNYVGTYPKQYYTRYCYMSQFMIYMFQITNSNWAYMSQHGVYISQTFSHHRRYMSQDSLTCPKYSFESMGYVPILLTYILKHVGTCPSISYIFKHVNIAFLHIPNHLRCVRMLCTLFLIYRLAFHTKCVATANCGAIDRTCLNSILAWLPNSWDVPQSDCDILKLL